MRIDLNCDLGEREDLADRSELELLECVTSANIACGGHAGSDALMRLTVRQAHARGVAIGAHPGYADRGNFGRVELQLSAAELEASVAAQVERLIAIAAQEGASVRYVKPHGALYNQAARDRAIATAIARGVAQVDTRLALVGLAGSVMLETWRELGFAAIAEGFADRRYEPDGSLRARRYPDALLNAEESAAQAVVLAANPRIAPGSMQNLGGFRLETLCLHGDAEGAVERARAVRDALERAGVAICPWQSGGAPG
jgi:UPF0271 protein